jgi:hypothetical protein
MKLGIDTSGKINQLPMYTCCICLEKPTNLLKELRMIAGKRKPVLKFKRILKASDLSFDELKFVVDKLGTDNACHILKQSEYNKIKELSTFFRIMNWEMKLLALIFFRVSNDFLRKDIILYLHKDYSEKSINTIVDNFKAVCSINAKPCPKIRIVRNVDEEVSVDLADKIVGAMRKGIISDNLNILKLNIVKEFAVNFVR